MRNIVIVALALVLVSSSVYAAEPDGVSIWLYLSESLAGFVGGFGMMALTANLVDDSSDIETNSDETVDGATKGEMYLIMGSSGLGTAGGVLLVGELFGAVSENKATTYLSTTGASLVFPLVLAAVIDTSSNEDSGDFGSGFGRAMGYGLLIFADIFVNPHITAATYNVVKKPTTPKTKEVGFQLKPYSSFMADSGGSYFPTYGVSLSF